MRISITAEKSLIDELKTSIDNDPESQVERVEEAKDQTELAFGIAEALTVVAIVKGVSTLVGVVMDLKKRFGSKTQKLHLKTALGTMIIELSPDITAEQLQQQLAVVMK